jgi:hypothetical protein
VLSVFLVKSATTNAGIFHSVASPVSQTWSAEQETAHDGAHKNSDVIPRSPAVVAGGRATSASPHIELTIHFFIETSVNLPPTIVNDGSEAL